MACCESISIAASKPYNFYRLMRIIFIIRLCTNISAPLGLCGRPLL